VENLRNTPKSFMNEEEASITKKMYCGNIYTGPFFVNCDHGCYHGDCLHGAGNPSGCMGKIVDRDFVFKACISGIDAADYIYAWVGSDQSICTLLGIGRDVEKMDRYGEILNNLAHLPTMYGTLFELGYAYSKGKKIYLAMNVPQDELWFAKIAAEKNISARNPNEGYAKFLKLVGDR